MSGPLVFLTRKWNRILIANGVVRVLSITAVAVAWAYAWWGGWEAIWIGLASFAASAAGVAWFFQKKWASPPTMARHLNNEVPELEHSAELWLKPHAEHNLLEAMQLARIHALARGWVGRTDLTRDAFHGALRLVVFAIPLALLVPWLFPSGPVPWMDATLKRVAETQKTSTPAKPIEITAVSIAVQPPDYTQIPPWTHGELEIEVEEGADVSWRLEFDRELLGAALHFGDGSTLDMEGGPSSFTASRNIDRPGFYFLKYRTRDGPAQQSPYFQIQTKQDQPPRVTILHPETSRLVLEPDQTSLSVAAEVSDDYGLIRGDLVLTLARGTGENVRFREKHHPIEILPAGARQTYEKVLDFPSLGVEPGDELYGYFEVEDNRQPRANRTRSESFMVVVTSREEVIPVSSEGIAVRILPAYFRSQRQIIIDTERLIAERSAITEREFRKRSHALGVDQKSLRLRYGQFLGEEFSSQIGPAAVPSEPEHDDKETSHDHGTGLAEADSHDHEEEGLEEDETSEADQAIAPFVHFHDSQEIKTFFSDPIQEQLRAALAQMWDAELHLRTFRPERALPFEYKALEILKEVQQASRVYVQRVGFEPPPIPVDELRFSGDLTPIENRTVRDRDPPTGEESLLRQALATIGETGQNPPGDQALASLRATKSWLSDRAAREPARYLSMLNEITALLGIWEAGGRAPPEHLARLTRAFWNVLPEPHRVILKPTAATPMARDYLALLSRVGTGPRENL